MVYCTMSTNLTESCCHKNQITNFVDTDLILSRKKRFTLTLVYTKYTIKTENKIIS